MSSTPHPVARLVSSENPARRAVERYWLLYTPVWGLVAGAVMVGGLAEGWGDVELMGIGVAFAAGALGPPLVWPHPSERARPVWDRVAFKLGVAVVGFSFGMNYFCTPYFFDVLHMHYGFATEVTVDRNPVFLYFMTVAYFATYLVLVCGSYRALSRWLGLRARWLGGGLAAFAVAALETLLNANPFMESLFCFDDMPFMLWFGTLSYGACFVFALPVWMGIDERPRERTPLSKVSVSVLAATMGIVITFEVLRHLVAPHVTEVADGTTGLRDYATSCLVRAE